MVPYLTVAIMCFFFAFFYFDKVQLQFACVTTEWRSEHKDSFPQTLPVKFQKIWDCVSEW